ncbi:MAG: arsenic-transporting ATPase [Acidobacteria bacterium]|nr:MAG: arsenic-transporting ATPase [Acidobacteriota bacterium]
MRSLVFTGKGGVGKTTLAAATGVRASKLGYRTLVISTDPAHSLADAFDLEIGHEVTPISDGLFCRQVDAQRRLEDGWGEIRDHLVEILNWSGVDGVEAEELAVFPGLEEIFGLIDLADYAQSGEWDLLIVDSAPTAETLRFLSLPDVMRWWMRKVWPAGRSVVKVVRPVLTRVTSAPVASDGVLDATEGMYSRLAAARALLSNGKRSSIRLVLNPEKVVLAESRRTYTYLSLFGYSVDAVIANRLLPDEVSDPWFADWRSAQIDHLAEVRDSFGALPVLEVPLTRREPYGLTALDDLAQVVYGDSDPAAVMSSDEPMTVVESPEGYDLHLRLPFADKSDLEVARNAEDLFVRAGPYKRALVLPQALLRREIVCATFQDEELVVSFR